MNRAILIGNLTRDPELTMTSGGVGLCKFSIAVNRAFTNANGERETDFFNISTWRGLAENCAKYLYKGSKVAISGTIQTRNYEDKDGNKRFSFDIVAEDVEFLTPKKDGNEQPPNEGNVKSKEKPKRVELKEVKDDLPF